MMALTLSICFVFLIMGVLFESFILPLSILTTIPLSLFGVYWTLHLTNTSLDMMAAIGLIILMRLLASSFLRGSFRWLLPYLQKCPCWWTKAINNRLLIGWGCKSIDFLSVLEGFDAYSVLFSGFGCVFCPL